MKIPRHLLLVLFFVSASSHAETLCEINFASQPAGEIRLGQSIRDGEGVAGFWEGPQPRENGHFAIKEAPEGTDSAAGKSVLAIYDDNSENNKAPAFTVGLSKIPTQARTMVFDTRILIPVSGSYRGLINLGKGSWASAATVFMLTEGKLMAWQSGDTYTTVGSYTPNTWMTVRVTLDLAKKTYDVEVNDQKTGMSLPWAHTKNVALNYFEFIADLNPRDRAGEPVLYVEYVKITSE